MQKTKYSNFSLTGTTISILFVTTIVIQLVVGLFFYSWQRSSQFADLDMQLLQITDQAERHLESSLWNFDNEQIQQTVRNYMLIPNVNRMTVKDDKGNILCDERKNEVDQPILSLNEKDDEQSHVQKTDIVKDGERLGSLEVSLTTYRTAKRLHHYLVSAVLSILIVALVQIATLYFLFRKTIISPLKAIGQFAATVGSRTENLPDPPRGLFTGELKELRHSIVMMVSALHDSEKSYRSLFENSLEGIFQTTIDGKFIKANSALAAILGYRDPEELVLNITNIGEQLHLDQEKRDQVVNLLVKNRTVKATEVALRHRDGHALHCLLSMRAVPDERGRIASFEGSLIDISGRKQIEQQLFVLNQKLESLVEQRTEQLNIRNAELIASEERYRNLVESMQEGILVVDRKGIFTFANRQMSNMLGLSTAELLGMECSRFLESGDLEIFQARIKAPAGQSVAKFEVSFTRLDGRHVATLVSPTTVYNKEGEYDCSFAVVTDITTLKQLQSQLFQSQKLESIGQLAAGIAHEINTPTQYVANNVRFLKDATDDLIALERSFEQLMQAGQDGQEITEALKTAAIAKEKLQTESLLTEIPEAFEDIFEGLERISTIVSSVKRFAHPGQDGMAPADLNEAIRSTVTVSTNEWKYVADLETDLDPQLPPVLCVVSAINQVVLNLIVNAAHAIAEATNNGGSGKGTIRVQTRKIADQVEIRVVDSGKGIPEAIRNRIFDPFFTTKDVGKGTGQGLAIARTIICETHHGTLEFESEIDRGTTFIARLPLQKGKTP
jgi:PAS domain S-box-containing protein